MLANHGLVAPRLRPLLGPIRGLADVTLVGFQTRTSYGVNVYSKTIRQDFMEAWKAAVNWNWETILQIQRGECPSNQFMQFRIGISDATFTRLINSGELWRIAPGHLRLYTDVDTKLRDDQGEPIYSVAGQRGELPDLWARYRPPRPNATAEDALALAAAENALTMMREVFRASSETLTQAAELAQQKGLPDDEEVALYDILSRAARHVNKTTK